MLLVAAPEPVELSPKRVATDLRRRLTAQLNALEAWVAEPQQPVQPGTDISGALAQINTVSTSYLFQFSCNKK
jgi:hypothetical protein